jgi:hypothetical protein
MNDPGDEVREVWRLRQTADVDLRPIRRRGRARADLPSPGTLGDELEVVVGVRRSVETSAPESSSQLEESKMRLVGAGRRGAAGQGN